MNAIEHSQLIALFYSIRALERTLLPGLTGKEKDALHSDLLKLKELYRTAAQTIKQEIEGSTDPYILHHYDELTNHCSIYDQPLI